MPRPRNQVDAIVEGRLINWARAMSGSPIPTRYSANYPSPDELDADVVEKAVLQMKECRRPYYDVIELKWLFWRDDFDSSDILRCSLREYRSRYRSALLYLGPVLDRLDSDAHRKTG